MSAWCCFAAFSASCFLLRLFILSWIVTKVSLFTWTFILGSIIYQCFFGTQIFVIPLNSAFLPGWRVAGTERCVCLCNQSLAPHKRGQFTYIVQSRTWHFWQYHWDETASYCCSRADPKRKRLTKTVVREDLTIKSVKMKVSTLWTLHSGYCHFLLKIHGFVILLLYSLTGSSAVGSNRADQPVMFILLSLGAGHLPASYLCTDLRDTAVHAGGF